MYASGDRPTARNEDDISQGSCCKERNGLTFVFDEVSAVSVKPDDMIVRVLYDGSNTFPCLGALRLNMTVRNPV